VRHDLGGVRHRCGDQLWRRCGLDEKHVGNFKPQADDPLDEPGQRCLIGAFPWRYEGLEGCPCRIVCFLDTDMSVEAVGDAAKAIIRS